MVSDLSKTWPFLVIAWSVILRPFVAAAADIHVMISGGLNAAVTQLAPEFERATGHKILIARGASMGSTPTAIPVRLSRGEPADILIMVGYSLSELAGQGKVIQESRVDLVRSPIGVAIRAGTPRPDISTVDGLRKSLLVAKSIAYSDSASGVYVGGELFKKLGIEDQIKSKSRMIPGTPVAEIVAKGDAEIGFQRMSELLAVQGVDVIGPIPSEVQKITIFSAGLATQAKEPDAARAFIQFLRLPSSAAMMAKTGLDPI